MSNTGVIRYNPIRDVLGASTSASLSTPMRELLEQGASAYQTGALDVAADRLSQAIRLNGELQGGYLALAICRARVGKYHDALRFLDAELRGADPHPRAPQLKSDILTWLGVDGHKKNAGIPITLFTIPKPFKGLIGTIQRNALKSWLKLSHPPEILVLGNAEGTAEIAQELGLRHIPETAVNEYGTPLISSIFRQAQSVASHDLMAYANTDIIFTETFTVALQALTNQERFLVVGRRWDIDSWEPMDFEASSWSEQVMTRAKQTGLLHGSAGIDYLIFRKGLYPDLPPFAVGRTAWDNWLIWEAKHQGAKLIDATHAIHAFHQEHSYTHAHGGVKTVWNGAEARRNRELACGNAMTIQDADFCMEGGNIVRIHDGYRRPEPTQQDYTNLKFRQSMAAYLKGQYAQALDLLEYIELDTNNCILPAIYYIHKAKVLQAVAHSLVKETEYNTAKPLCFAEVNEQERRNNIVFINTYYQAFIDRRYRTNLQLSSEKYAEQIKFLIATRFGDSDFYSEGLKRAGWQSDNLIINCAPLQQAWAKENGCHSSGFELVAEQVRRSRSQAVYIQDMNMIPAEFLAAIRPYTDLIVGQIATPVVKKIPFAQYDIIISSFPHYVTKSRAAGLTAYYQPLAFDPRVLKDLPVHPYSQRPVACSFVGGVSALHIHGNQLLDHLARQTPIEFWGYGVESLSPDSPIRCRHHGEAWGKEMFSILGASRITVNRHGEVAENYANNMRLFEATGCGTLLVTDYKDNLNELFEIGKEVVAYRSMEECADLINYYLANPKDAEKIARAGQERTLREHTYVKRMEQTAEILNRHLRYRREKERFPAPDLTRVSYGNAFIKETEVSEEMTTAWKDRSLPAKQRALVQQELASMYRGKIPTPFQVLADILQTHTFAGCSVLEIGCASGYYYEILEYLLKRRINYTGVDYSEAMIGMAKDYYPRAAFSVADGADLPFDEREFHVAISSGVLLHLPNYPDHIAETVRVARHFVVAHRTPVCRRRPSQFMKKFAYGVETVEILFNEEQLLAEFNSHGLELLKRIEYQAPPRKDEYGVTYLFEKRGALE